MSRSAWIVGAAFLAAPGRAHERDAPQLGIEPLDALLAAGAAALALLYLRGAARSWRPPARVSVLCFAVGWSALVAALFSPVDTVGSRLFVAHMLQHELLMLVAAPLLVASRPTRVLLRGLPNRLRRIVGRSAREPTARRAWWAVSTVLGAWVLHALALWAWHAPGLFALTLRDDFVHALQHASFFGSALLYRSSTIGRPAARRDRSAALASLFGTALHGGALGALMTLSPRPWISAYASTAPAFGLTGLEDQQLAGLVMWIPASFVLMSVGLRLASAWLQQDAAGATARTPTSDGADPAALGSWRQRDGSW